MCVRRKHNASPLLLLLLLSLFIAACSSTPQHTISTSTTLSPTPSTTIRVILEPVPNSGTPSPAEMDTASATLLGRLTAFGLKNVHISQVTSSGQPALQVEVPHFSEDKSSTLDALLVRGQLEFWLTGSTSVQPNTSFDPTQYLQYNPGDKAEFINNDLDASKIFVSQDPQTGQPEVNLAMKSSAAGKFFTYTQQNIGQYLTVTLDRKVIASPVIQNAISGQFVIAGNFTSQEANTLASIFKYSSLPVAFRKSVEMFYTPN